MPRPGTSTTRGYGRPHRRLRAALAPLVATGTVTCWRCGKLIAVGAAWDLGHDDDDPTHTRYRGPEHRGPCNRSAGARKGNAMRAPVVFVRPVR